MLLFKRLLHIFFYIHHCNNNNNDDKTITDSFLLLFYAIFLIQIIKLETAYQIPFFRCHPYLRTCISYKNSDCI